MGMFFFVSIVSSFFFFHLQSGLSISWALVLVRSKYSRLDWTRDDGLRDVGEDKILNTLLVKWS